MKLQNNAIFAAEQQRNELEEQFAKCKGIFKAGRRSELSRQIADKNECIANMKARLCGIVREYEFKNVESFYKELRKTESANEDYQNRSKKWEQQYREYSHCQTITWQWLHFRSLSLILKEKSAIIKSIKPKSRRK